VSQAALTEETPQRLADGPAAPKTTMTLKGRPVEQTTLRTVTLEHLSNSQ